MFFTYECVGFRLQKLYYSSANIYRYGLAVSLFDEDSLTNFGKAIANAIRKLFSIAMTTDYSIWQCFLKIKPLQTQNEIAIFSNYIKLTQNVNAMVLYIEQQQLIKSRYIPSNKDNKRRMLTKDVKILPFGLREGTNNRCIVQMIQEIIENTRLTQVI